MALTPKQAQFVAEYLVDLNATQAAIRAGYSPDTARAIGSENLSKPDVAAAIAEAQAERAKRTEITQDRVLKELAKIGFADISDVITWGTKQIAIGYDEDGKKLPPDEIADAVLVRHEPSAFVEAMDSDSLPSEARAAVAEVALTKNGLRIKMHDKRAALESIGKHLGMFKDRHEHEGSLTIKILDFDDPDPEPSE